MARYLITGATGLIGMHLLPLFGREDVVYCLGRRAPRPGGIDARLEFLAADLAGDWNADMLPDGLDAVIHLAQSPHYRDFPDKALHMLALNTDAPLKLADHARRNGARFVFASSGGVYGAGKEGFYEHDQPQPASELGFYLGTKLCAELLLENYASFIDVTIPRFFFVYGRGQRPDALIPRLVDAVRSGRPVTLAGSDGISLNPVYAEDAARALFDCISHPGSRKLNIAGPEILTMRQVAETIGQVVGVEPVFEHGAGDAHANFIGDITAMTSLVGAPATSFRQGLLKAFG